LCGWAEAQWPYLDGRCLLGGLDLGVLPARRFLHVVAALLRERALETEEEAKAHERVNVTILRSMQDPREDPEDADGFPGLRVKPLGG
jgi:hypothetical protein